MPSAELLTPQSSPRPALQVRFAWQQDRFAYRIEVQQSADSALVVWESIEGSPVDPWPPSPPFQQLSIESRPGGSRVALLIGMAGHSHWSGSIEVAGDGRSLEFDFACRTSEPTPRLGSEYRRFSGTAPPYEWGALVGELVEAASSLRFQPSAAENSPTRRWRYRLRLTDLGSSP